MKIAYRYYWRWGDITTIIYNCDIPGSRDDLRRVIQEAKDAENGKKKNEEIIRHEFYVVELISTAKVLEHLNAYPTHDLS